MAENRLDTIIQLRYGTYAQWMNSDVILRAGEAAICTFSQSRAIEDMSNARPENTPPAVGIKVGDGSRYFRELPWVQAIAADVYNWAKSSAKPTYTAQEIQGLQAFVENLVSGDVEVTIAPRIYQLYEGTGNNANKYYLRYKENNEESDWILDTSTTIDLNDLVEIRNWIGSFMEDYPTMGTATGTQTLNFINNLNKVDSAVTHKFVTEVSESKGIITVERQQPDFSDLSGHADVTQGGTGRTTFPEDEVLVGDGTNRVKTVPIADAIGNNTSLVPNYVIKNYVDNAVAGLTGAMHFIGDATVVIQPNSSVDPRIPDYNFSTAQPGDVILYDSKEFVWTGIAWRLLGDEGSYAVKGSIVDADIDAEAEIQQSKISGLASTFNTKVDKEEGKSLTSNDFTDEYVQKLDEIAAGAQVNTIEHIFVNGTEVLPTTINDITKSVGINFTPFTDEEKLKLRDIEADAQVNKVETITINGTAYTPGNDKNIDITIDQAALDLNVLEGARVPTATPGVYEDINITTSPKKLELSRVSKTGLISDLLQSPDTYIVLNCGTSTTIV